MLEEFYYFVKNFLILSSVLTGGTVLATIFISKMYWKSFDDCIKQLHGIHSLESESESESEPETMEEKFYKDEANFHQEMVEWQYYLIFEFNNLEEKKLSDDYLKSLYDKEFEIKTPLGKIIIFYNFENDCFEYYCDKKDIPYWFFEPLCRAYVIEFDCKSIHKNILLQIEKLKEKNITSDENNSVFLKKNKTIVDHENLNFKEIINLYGDHKDLKYNRYIYKGNLICYQDLLDKKNKNNDFVNISFKDFLELKKKKLRIMVCKIYKTFFLIIIRKKSFNFSINHWKWYINFINASIINIIL